MKAFRPLWIAFRAAVVAADVAADGLDKTCARAGEIGAGDRLTTLEMNVGDENSVVDGVRSAVDTLGGLDSLVNAAETHARPRLLERG